MKRREGACGDGMGQLRKCVVMEGRLEERLEDLRLFKLRNTLEDEMHFISLLDNHLP